MDHVEPVTPRLTDEDYARMVEAHDRFWNDPIVCALVVYKTRRDRGELAAEEVDAYEREIEDARTRRFTSG
jgi:hypothetical protein